LHVYVEPAENTSAEPAEGAPAEPADGTIAVCRGAIPLLALGNTTKLDPFAVIAYCSPLARSLSAYLHALSSPVARPFPTVYHYLEPRRPSVITAICRISCMLYVVTLAHLLSRACRPLLPKSILP
jgi:hypothetical protein